VSLSETWQTSLAFLTSLGGGGAIVVWLSSWLGKVWAARILEQDRRKYTIGNESPRSKLRGINPPLAYSHGPASLAGP